MIKTLTCAHSYLVRGANATARLIVARLQHKFDQSNNRSLAAITLRSEVTHNTGLVIELEGTVRKSLINQIKQAQRLVNA